MAEPADGARGGPCLPVPPPAAPRMQQDDPWADEAIDDGDENDGPVSGPGDRRFAQDVSTWMAVAPSVRPRLQQAGYRTVGDLLRQNPAEISLRAGLAIEDARRVHAAAKAESRGLTSDHRAILGAVDASALAPAERSRRRVVTFCADLDRLLGRGIPLGEVTEIAGAPGVGKTQLCCQLALAVQIPRSLAGVGGEAIYVDCEGSFMPGRLAEMADAMARQMQRAGAVANAGADAATALTVPVLLTGVRVIRAQDYAQLRAVVAALPSLLESQQSATRLIVIDSVAFHLRQGFGDMAERAQALNEIGRELRALGATSGRPGGPPIAVVVTNHMTVQVSPDGTGRLVPALGEAWAHAVANRVVLFWQGGHRCAHLAKCAYLPAGVAPFRVAVEGIRTVRGERKRPAGEGEEAGGGKD